MSAQLRVLDVQLDSFAPSNHALWPDRSLCCLSGPDVPAGGPPPHRLPSGEWVEPSDYSDGYWTGSASLPRIGQKDNVNLILYRPPPQVYAQPDVRKSMFPFDYTHAGNSPVTPADCSLSYAALLHQVSTRRSSTSSRMSWPARSASVTFDASFPLEKCLEVTKS